MTTEEVSFTNSKGHSLSGIIRYTEPVEPVKYPVVIILHGFNEHKHHDLTADIANNLVYYGFMTLRFDFHGHGESEGEFEDHTISQQLDDVISAIDFVSQLENANQDKICIIGTDIGGNIALLTSEKDGRVKALVVQGARSHFDNHLKSHFADHEIDNLMRTGVHDHVHFRIRNSYVRNIRTHDVIDSLKRCHAPVLFLHGLGDLRVRLEETRQLYLGANDPKQIIEVDEADHWFRGHREELVEASAQWFRRWV